MDVGGTKTELTLAGLEIDVFGTIQILELLGDFKGAIRGTIVNNDNLPIQVAVQKKTKMLARLACGLVFYPNKCAILFSESLLDQPNNDREVLPLVVGW